SLFKGPGFSVDSVVIHEDPSIGAEPVAYIEESSGAGLEVKPSLWSLLGGRFVVASISLDGASINLTKSGPAGEWGRWNFSSFVDRSVMSATPSIHVRDSRVNFKFGDTKAVFYLLNTDLDISPPSVSGAGWRVSGEAKLARTDRAAEGLGSVTVNGRWYVAPERVDVDVELNRSGLGEITALLRGQAGGVHGTVSARMHLAGPIGNIGVAGRLLVEDVHRWDLLPEQGAAWPMDIGGSLDLVGQRLQLQTSSARNVPLPLSLRLQVSNYLAQPHWNLALDWNKFPIAPLLELAGHMGVQMPPGLLISGTIDGSLHDSDSSAFGGQLAFHDAAVAIPNSPPVRFENAYLSVDGASARLSPAVVRTATGEEAGIEGAYDMAAGSLDLSIQADAMPVAALRAQASLAAVPWLDQVKSGEWSGLLRYHRDPTDSGWSGRLQVKDAALPADGFADPLKLASARARIDGARVTVDRMQGALGKIVFTGDYAYEPGAPHPHRLHMNLAKLDAADLEDELAPTLRRAGLIDRALGRAPVPGWLRDRAVDAAIRVDDVAIAGLHWQNLRTHLLWDVTHASFSDIRANMDDASLVGKLAVNLRGARPSYALTAKVTGLPWQDGTADVEGEADTSGSGAQLLTNLTSHGTFTATGMDLGGDVPFHAMAGSFNLEWWQTSPRLRLTDLSLRADGETYTGRGATQDDGRLSILMANGSKELRMSGTLANLKVDQAVR
ncbi:MAG TPA: hypothetical protein VMU19_13115, partial [Bryobacteraceae bacterium]|nr:hypothetical protein [Bryobacteraceae bacterium]